MAAKKQQLKVAFKDVTLVPLSQLKDFGGRIKTMTPKAQAKLERQLARLGICVPIMVWPQGKDSFKILDGHQRVQALKAMIKKKTISAVKGDIMVPVSFSNVKTPAEACETHLTAAGTYGKLNKPGFEEFIRKNGIKVDFAQQSFSFPEMGNLNPAKQKEKKVSFTAKEKQVQCPECNTVFPANEHKYVEKKTDVSPGTDKGLDSDTAAAAAQAKAASKKGAGKKKPTKKKAPKKGGSK